jgi:hypothetical protein
MSPRLLRPRSAAAGGFDPRSISGNNLWLDFSDTASLTLDGNGLISQLNDKSGNGFHVSQSTAANRPSTGTLNGRQCGDWGTSTSSKELNYTAGANTSNWQDIAIVAVWDAGGTGWTNDTVAAGLITSGGGTGIGICLIGDTVAGNTNWYVSFKWWTGLLMNGTESTLAFQTIKSPFIAQPYSSSVVGVNGIKIGMDRTIAGRGWRGRIGEVIAYSRQLTTTERATVRQYLQTKWGV